MRLGIIALLFGYVMSQFYRACLAVLTPVLDEQIGASATDLSLASGLWFLTFALMQFPVGWALDKFGPRITTSVMLAVGGGGGAAIFAVATTPLHVQIAMSFIGIGCAPVLMASFFIFARAFPAAMFATLGGTLIGIGTMGNLASAAPLAMAAAQFGWRESLWALSLITLVISVAIWLFVRDPQSADTTTQDTGSIWSVFTIQPLWVVAPLLFFSYAAAAGLRGLWAGPYMQEVFFQDSSGIGLVTLAMGAGMSVGSFLYGPLDRIFKTRKWVIIGGNAGTFISLLCLAFWPSLSFTGATILLSFVGIFGMSYPLMMAHGRSFIPPHLLGRGVSMLNLCSIAGVGSMQALSSYAYDWGATTSAASGYQALFLFFAIPLGLSSLIYLISQDRLD
ncbi:MAG: MFS transporter, partial [Candidatus Puniceispirillaceae bacterium]